MRHVGFTGLQASNPFFDLRHDRGHCFTPVSEQVFKLARCSNQILDRLRQFRRPVLHVHDDFGNELRQGKSGTQECLHNRADEGSNNLRNRVSHHRVHDFNDR